MSTRPASLKGTAQRVKSAYEKARSIIFERGNQRLSELWPQWEERFQSIYRESHKRPQVAISLVGGTGAGKSTLLNALIDARVLPVSNMRACTAAICEVAFRSDNYEAEVEFVTRSEWHREIQTLCEDIRDARELESEFAETAAGSISRAALDRLRVVYDLPKDIQPAEIDPEMLIEPDDVREALDGGKQTVSSGSLSDFRKQVKLFLASDHHFWPIVKRVSLRGPFRPLEGGIRLIDLPGLNDPNEAREEVTRRYLKECRFVWIVFGIKRALTKDMTNLMQSDDFVRQIVMDGRTDALTFVGTASDDIDLETGIEEFQLDEEASEIEVIRARNSAAREIIQHQLQDVSIQLADRAREDRQQAAKLAQRLQASQCYTVSAREYMRISGLSKHRTGPMVDIEESEIPLLRQHMIEISGNYGIQAHCRTMNQQLDLLLQEIRRELKSQQVALAHKQEMTTRQREEVESAARAAQDFLTARLADIHERLAQDLEASHALLGERLRSAVERGRREMTQLMERWSRMHWGSIRAVCRRDGVFQGATGRHDFPADVAAPVLDSITFAWSDFFGERLGQCLEKWTDRLVRHADEYRNRLLEALRSQTEVSPELIDDLDGILSTTEDLLQELLAQVTVEMGRRIEKERRQLYEQIPEQVAMNMLEGFQEAAEESGAGMKQRMIGILSSHANRVAGHMFDDARETIQSGVRSLNNWIGLQFQGMTEAVSRHASLAAENLLSDKSQLTGEALALEQNLLAELSRVMEDLLTGHEQQQAVAEYA